MKKLVMLGVLAASVSAFAAVNDLVLTFSSEGPDTYADGTTVLDGECYALVWQPTGSTGFALAADGTVADPAQGELILTAPVAKGGRCPTVAFQVAAAFADRHADGTWALYLLDTRRTSESGAVSLAGTANGRAKAVNAIGQVAGASVRAVAAGGASAPLSAGATAGTVAAEASALPADVPQPTVKGVRVEGGYVYVTVENTVPYLRYNLAAGTDPADVGGANAAKNPVSGNADGEIILVAPANDAGGFFRVRRD